jgi:hypothetical protein
VRSWEAMEAAAARVRTEPGLVPAPLAGPLAGLLERMALPGYPEEHQRVGYDQADELARAVLALPPVPAAPALANGPQAGTGYHEE